VEFEHPPRHLFEKISIGAKPTYVEKLTVALRQNAWEAHVTSIDCLLKAGFADLTGT
jgi:hypothetical protein